MDLVMEHTKQQVQWNHLLDSIKDTSLSCLLTIKFPSTSFTTATSWTSRFSRPTATDTGQKKNKRLQKDYLVHFLSSRSYIHYIPYLPSWYPVWTSTAHTACTIACAVSTDGADHALIQLPLVHPWLAHHALFLLLLQLILQIFIHGCGHVLHTKGYTKKTQQLS